MHLRNLIVITLLVLCALGLYTIYFKLTNRLITTTDVDIMYPNFKNKAFIISFDDGLPDDTIAIHILNKYKIKATFYLTIEYLNNTDSTAIYNKSKGISASDIRRIYFHHEIGSHSYHHVRLNENGDSTINFNLRQSKLLLEQYSQKPVTSLAYPYGDYNAAVISAAIKSGYTNARTIQNTKLFKPPIDWMQWHPTCEFMDMGKYIKTFCRNENGVISKIKRLIDKERKPLKIFTVWAHSYVLAKAENASYFEEICSKLSMDSTIWFASAGDIARYYENLRTLIITKYEIKNPESNTEPVYLKFNKSNFLVKPGEVFNLKQKKVH